MAKAPIVSRTITSTVVDAFCIDLITKEPKNISITVARTYKNEDALLKAVKKVADSDTLKVISIESFDTVTQRRGMSEDTFIANSYILPPLPTKESE